MATINPVDLALQSLGCTQTALAKRLGVKRATVSAWKLRGSVPVKAVKRMAEITGIPAYVLSPVYFPAPTIETRPEYGKV